MAEQTKSDVRRSYTREYKQEAVRLANESGLSVARVARDLGLNKNTLYKWRQELANDTEQTFPGKGKLKPQDEELRRLRREVQTLRQERDFLKKSRGLAGAGSAQKYRLIASQAGMTPVKLMCRAAGVSRSGYYASKRRPPSRRSVQNHNLEQEIRTIFRESRQTYGSPRVWSELKGKGGTLQPRPG